MTMKWTLGVIAVATVLAQAAPAGAVVLVQNYSTTVTSGSPFGGQFDLSAQLSNVAGQFRATSGVLTVLGYSPTQPTSSVGGYGAPQLITSFTDYFFGTISLYERFRTATQTDLVADSMALTTSAVLGADTVDVSRNQTQTTTVSTVFSPENHRQDYYRETRTYYELSGGLSIAGTLLGADLSNINDNGILNFSISAPIGQHVFYRASLDLQLEALPPPPPGSTVPEPATWALMIGGFGLAGAALRRRGAACA
jgi:hypothetical protein